MSVRSPSLDGLIVVDKPGRSASSSDAAPRLPSDPAERLVTSHDVVAQVRRWSGQRRIGHTGTLDPMASGVLLLCLGTATRLVEYYQGEEKAYYAEIVLGAATDTYDAQGVVTATAPVPLLSAATLESALAPFRGEIEQTPPAFSAIKQGGKALYHRARRGETVVVPTRRVTFFALDLLDFVPPARVMVRVRCSAGAYIRSLAHDLGQLLGVGGYLDVLRREQVGAFLLAQAATLDEIAAMAIAGRLPELLLAPGTGLPLPTLRLTADESRRLGYGQLVSLPTNAMAPDAGLLQAIDAEGALAGIIRRVSPAAEGADSWIWKAEKWLRQETDDVDLS